LEPLRASSLKPPAQALPAEVAVTLCRMFQVSLLLLTVTGIGLGTCFHAFPFQSASLALAASLGEHLVQGAGFAVHCRKRDRLGLHPCRNCLGAGRRRSHQAWKLISDA
jgi:hypothetical protein